MDKSNGRRQKIFRVVRSALKILALSLTSILLITMVGGLVFVNILAGHLQENILPLAQVNLDDYQLDQTS